MNLYRRFTRWSVTAPRKRPHMLRHYCASQWLRRLNELASGPSQDPRAIPENAGESGEDSQRANENGP